MLNLSTYARQFLSVMDKAEIESIEGLFHQSQYSRNPLPITQDQPLEQLMRCMITRDCYLQELECQNVLIMVKSDAKPVVTMVSDTIREEMGNSISVFAPIIMDGKGEHIELLGQLMAEGFSKVKIDNEMYQINKVPILERNVKHNISVLVDQLKIDNSKDCKQRLTESIETALTFSDGSVDISSEKKEYRLSNKHSCPKCNYSVQELEPKFFF